VDIIIDYTPALKQQGGIGRYARGLFRALANLDAERRYILLATSDCPDDRFSWPDNFTTKRIPLTERVATVLWYRLGIPFPAKMLSSEARIFHSPNYSIPPVLGAKSIVTIHDLSFMVLPQYAYPSLKEYLSKAVPKAVRRADYILADSEATKRDLMNLSPLQVPEERISVVYSGVDPIFRPQDEDSVQATRRVLNIEGFPYILSVGTLEPRKNFDGLIKAFNVAKMEFDIPHHLVIAGGKGWLYERIVQEYIESPYREKIHFLGFVPDERLPALYTGADVFAYPSHYEGFGIPPLEALACGTPVLAARNSSMPEVLGDAALWVDDSDISSIAHGLYELVSNKDIRSSILASAKPQLEKFTWENGARALLKVYNSLGE
jgi:glycosyltransferase involved in cell wall biosynthesis